MLPHSNLNQIIKEVVLDFLRTYPIFEKHREELLYTTTNRILQRLEERKWESRASSLASYQLRVDILVELTKCAILIRELPPPKAIKQDVTPPVDPLKGGKIIYLPRRS